MAYVTSNPPAKIADALAGGPAVWTYKSADTDDTVIAANYITNALDLGMKIGDLVIIADTATPKTSLAGVTVVASTGSTMTFAAVA